MEPRSVAGFAAGVKTDLTRRVGGATTPEKMLVVIAFVVPLSPNNNGRTRIILQVRNHNLPKGPFTFAIVATHFFLSLLGLRIIIHVAISNGENSM